VGRWYVPIVRVDVDLWAVLRWSVVLAESGKEEAGFVGGMRRSDTLRR
jgi:hypothetical protein